MVLKLKPFDVAEFLTDDETIVTYLTEVFENEEPRYIAKALAAVARAKGGIAQLSANTGVPQDELQPALNESPDLGAVLKVMRALGIRLTASIDSKRQSEPEDAMAHSGRKNEATEEDHAWIVATSLSKQA
jgi:probable addiction module antidote protein